MERLQIWTDGSYQFSDGAGGWGVVLKTNDSDWHLELNGKIDQCPDMNYAEIYAVLSGICLVDEPSKLTIHTDSLAARQALSGKYLRDYNLRKLAKAIQYKAKVHDITVQIARPTPEYDYLRRCHDLSRMATRERFVELELKCLSDFRQNKNPAPESITSLEQGGN